MSFLQAIVLGDPGLKFLLSSYSVEYVFGDLVSHFLVHAPFFGSFQALSVW